MRLRSNAFPPAIASIDDWLKEWPPQMGLKHWQNGKSAKELAKAWFANSGSPVIPPGLHRLLESHPLTQQLSIEAVIGESKIPLDAGRPRHADLILRARVAETPVLIHVEAKADETFARTCECAWRTALRKDGLNSTLPDRMSRLCHLLFGTKDFERRLENMPPEFRLLRYQLLYATVATILDAARQGIAATVFVVHELLPDDMTKPFLRDDGTPRPLLRANDAKKNATDLKRFVGVLTKGRVNDLPAGELIDVGKFTPRPADWLHLTKSMPVRLLVGKAMDVTEQSPPATAR
jgi:hypothetical protein